MSGRRKARPIATLEKIGEDELAAASHHPSYARSVTRAPLRPGLRTRIGLIAVRLTLASLAASSLACSFGERPSLAQPGETAPEFQLPDAAGRTHSLATMLDGGAPAVVLFYVGHW
jgi:hypothetical protein